LGLSCGFEFAVKGAACGGEAFDTFMASSKVVLTSACNGKLEPIQDHVFWVML